MNFFYFTLILLALVPENLPPPGPVAWVEDAVPKSARAVTSKILVHADGPGCAVYVLKPASDGIVLLNLEKNRGVGISNVLGKPAYLDLEAGKGTLASAYDPAFAYCIEAVKRGKLITPALKARFLGFGDIK